MKTARNFSIVMLIALALTVAGCSAAPGTPVSEASSTAADTITVTGFGKARANPDRASVSVGVNVADEDITLAVEESNETIARITDAVMGLGVEEADIQTTNFSIWAEEQWDPETGQRKEEKLYRVDSTIQINVNDTEKIGKILETSIANGANNIYGLNFGIQDPSGLAAEARVLALEDARQRAEQITQELGVTLGEVQHAVEVSGGSVMPYFEAAMYGIGGGGGSPPISEGSMTVTVSIEVTFKINR
ncbi:MAG TPA: SIMPL domain-containing protein [Anaerolineae bacterium]|nr:SIMPL domain-containing protein [Anaerolineae bacterium]